MSMEQCLIQDWSGECFLPWLWACNSGVSGEPLWGNWKGKKRDDSTTAWNWAERFPSLDLLVLTMLSWDSPNICWQSTGEATLAWTKTPNTTKQAQWRSSVKLHKSCSSICTELIWTLFKCYHKKALFKFFLPHSHFSTLPHTRFVLPLLVNFTLVWK